MAIDTKICRRTVLQNAGAFAAFVTSGTAPAWAKPDEGQELYLAARRGEDGAFSAAVFSMQSGVLASVKLPGRGHGFAVQPGGGQAVCFARRPGKFAVAFKPKMPSHPPVWFAAGEGRHFYGHGVFSADGNLLYSAENQYDTGHGVIGVRDVRKGYAKIGEFRSFGTGPHEIALLSDGKTLVVANGGIETHPDLPRKKLNLASMSPSLVYLDVATGDLVAQHRLAPELHQLSIRHLTVAAKDTVVFGCQHQGPRTERPPLVGFQRRGGEIKLVQARKTAHLAMQNYVGSVARDAAGTLVATTSPRGNKVQFWDVARMAFMGQKTLKDVCGAAPRKKTQGFVLTTGHGLLTTMNAGGIPGSQPNRFLRHRQTAWDNHATSGGG